MPVIKVNDEQFLLRPGPNRVGGDSGAEVRIGEGVVHGIHAVVDVAAGHAVIRRTQDDASVSVNGVQLGAEPMPLLHGDKVDIAGYELTFADDGKVGATQYLALDDIAAMAHRRGGPRATAATGGRLVSLVDGKEYSIPSAGLTIGRDAMSDVVISDGGVSRRHAQVIPDTGGYVIRDHSVNGVYVNGNRIVSGEAHLLARADVIRIGSEELRFYADVAPLTQPSPASPSAAGVEVPSLAHTLFNQAQMRAPKPSVVNAGASSSADVDRRTLNAPAPASQPVVREVRDDRMPAPRHAIPIWIWIVTVGTLVALAVLISMNR